VTAILVGPRGDRWRRHREDRRPGDRRAAPAVDPGRLAEEGDRDVLGDVQAQEAQEWPEPEQPEVHRHAGHQAEEGRDPELEPGRIHAYHYGPPPTPGEDFPTPAVSESPIPRPVWGLHVAMEFPPGRPELHPLGVI